MDETLQQLQTQIDSIQKIIDGLSRSDSIDRNIETAFTERLNIVNAVNGKGTTTASTQSVNVPSVPTNITVPAQPSGALAVTYQGKTYNLLYK